MNRLLQVETQVLAEGREWTRQRLQERLQSEAEAMGAVCPHSGLLLKDVRRRPITLRTCVGEVCVQAAYGFSTKEQRWLCPARERWQLESYQRASPELQQRLDYSATQTGSYEKAAQMAARWGTPVSDDMIHHHVQCIAERAQKRPSQPPAPAPKNEAPFSLVITLDGWMVRERGPHWAAPPQTPGAERVAWHEVKSAVIYRLDQRAESAAGRGLLTQKKVVACPPGTEPLDFGAAVQAQALQYGLARAQETFVVADGALWLWRLIEDRFAGAVTLLDFYHASEHLWELAHHLHPGDPEAARGFVEPLLHQLRHGGQDRVISQLEELLTAPPQEVPPLQGAPDPQGASDSPLQGSVGYFLDHREHLGYKAVGERGGPIGSGAVESQCSQFQDRFKRTGQFWSRSGLAHLLALDVAVRNETFADLWN